MPRGTAHAGCSRGKARADMDMMTWLFDTAPHVALRFVHVSSSEWSMCRTLVCPRVTLRFVHVLTWLDATLAIYMDDDVVACVYNDVAAYIDDDMADDVSLRNFFPK
jgi:hypothetical protein